MSDNEKRPLTPEDLASINFLGEVQLAPDGKTVYYDVAYINREKNTYQGQIWRADLSEAQEQNGTASFTNWIVGYTKLTSGPRRDSTPRLSPDGSRLAFLSDRADDGKKQIFLLDLQGPGEARQLTTFQSGVNSLVWSSDSRYMVALVETPDDASKAALHARPETPDARREREAREAEAVRVSGNPIKFEQMQMRADGRRSLIPGDAHVQLWLVDTRSAQVQPRQITNGPYNVQQPAFSPDGRQLVFSSTRDQQQADLSCISDLWLLDPFAEEAGTSPVKLTDSRGPATSAAWSPDGRRLAFVGHTNPRDGSFLELNRVWLLDLDDRGKVGPARCLTADFDRPVANLLNTDLRVFGESPLAWSSDGSQVYFTASSEASVRLFRVLVEGEALPEPITAPDRHIYSYSFAPDTGQVAWASAAPHNPGDIFLQRLDANPDDEPRQLTQLNREWLKGVLITPPETIRVPSQDGTTEIEGWLIKPPGFDPAKKYPLVLEIHGGPHTSYGHSFNFEFQMLAGQGQVVLYTNPRGSIGYGYDFAAAIYNDWGHHDYDDVMTVVAWVIEQGYVDPTRLGVTGGSYGGYLTNWIITHTDRFRAALTQRCVSNLVSMYTLSDIGPSFVESEFEGDIWTNPRIWERSPMAHANKATTPTLILHSEADYRCPIEQAEEFYFALKRSGCPVEMVRTPNEDHNLSRNGTPDHRIGRLGRIADWFARHLAND